MMDEHGEDKFCSVDECYGSEICDLLITLTFVAFFYLLFSGGFN